MSFPFRRMTSRISPTLLDRLYVVIRQHDAKITIQTRHQGQDSERIPSRDIIAKRVQESNAQIDASNTFAIHSIASRCVIRLVPLLRY